MIVLSRGYKSLRQDDVRLEPWAITVGDGETLVTPNELENWTFYQSIAVKLTVLTDLAAIVERLQLDASAVLGAVIVWSSAGTSLRGASEIAILKTNETSLELTIDGHLLRGVLSLECQVILAKPGAGTSLELVPTIVGSVLWSQKHAVQLEGVGARMPILSVPFSKHFPGGGDRGLWWLHVGSSDLHSPADSLLWVWLNEENDAIQEMLEQPLSQGALRTQQFLKVDIFRQIVQIGLRDTEFSLHEEYPIGSLGAVIAAPMRILGGDLLSLRQRFEHDAHRLEAEIQARLGGI